MNVSFSFFLQRHNSCGILLVHHALFTLSFRFCFSFLAISFIDVRSKHLSWSTWHVSSFHLLAKYRVLCMLGCSVCVCVCVCVQKWERETGETVCGWQSARTGWLESISPLLWWERKIESWIVRKKSVSRTWSSWNYTPMTVLLIFK